MPASSDYSVSIPISPPPPQDLSSYARFMHDHTKRQMEASNNASSSPRRSSGRHAQPVGSAVTNGISPPDYRS
ncbi:Fc.00g052850.m01.CDS01 [Cosmosporella sp. VM-42]